MNKFYLTDTIYLESNKLYSAKEMFLNHLYGGMDEPELKIIDVFICKLRKKLSTAMDGENYIQTVWGRGYVLRDPEEVEEKIRANAWPARFRPDQQVHWTALERLFTDARTVISQDARRGTPDNFNAQLF